MGVTLGCRHPGMAKNLLHYADMHPLRDQQRGSSMAGVVDSGIPDLRLAEDSLPGSPVLGAFDWSAVAGSEYQIKVCPWIARSKCEGPGSVGSDPVSRDRLLYGPKR